MIIKFHDTPALREEVKKSRTLMNQLICWAHAIDCLNSELLNELSTVNIQFENNQIRVSSDNSQLMERLTGMFKNSMSKLHP